MEKIYTNVRIWRKTYTFFKVEAAKAGLPLTEFFELLKKMYAHNKSK